MNTSVHRYRWEGGKNKKDMPVFIFIIFLNVFAVSLVHSCGRNINQINFFSQAAYVYCSVSEARPPPKE